MTRWLYNFFTRLFFRRRKQFYVFNRSGRIKLTKKEQEKLEELVVSTLKTIL